MGCKAEIALKKSPTLLETKNYCAPDSVAAK